LNEQTVMVFADSAARTTALSGVLSEGMMSYLQDTDSVEVYDGSAWTAIGGGSSPLTTKGDLYTFSTVDARLGVGANGTVLTAASGEATGLQWAAPAGGGKVLQVVSMVKTNQFTQTTTTFTDITDYNLSITPSAATSKVLVMFNPALFIGGNVDTQLYQYFRILRDSTTIYESKGANVQGAAFTGGYAWQYIQASFLYLDSPNTTSAITYKAQTSASGLTPHGINNSGNSDSSIILMEIGA
jgi:hypothetical protein